MLVICLVLKFAWSWSKNNSPAIMQQSGITAGGMLVLWVHWPPGSFHSHPEVLAQPRIIYTSSSPVPLVFPVSSPCSPLHWPPRCVAASPLPHWVKLVQSMPTADTLHCLRLCCSGKDRGDQAKPANCGSLSKFLHLSTFECSLSGESLPGAAGMSPAGRPPDFQILTPWLTSSVTLGKRLNISEL